MNITQLILRLQTAYRSYSLRHLSNECEVSHEYLRKIINGDHVNVTVEFYNKIDQGLIKNGF